MNTGNANDQRVELEMTSVETYDPLNTLKSVAPRIWIVDGPIVHMRAIGLSIPFPTRMTVIQLASGDLFLHSPTVLTSGLKSELDALGPVRHLVSPNKLHYANIASWRGAYPDALAWGSPGVRERARSQGIELELTHDLAGAPDPRWAAEIDQLIVHGSRFLAEVVFLHRASRTLVLTDLIESFERDRIPRRWRWLARLGRVLDPDGQMPLDLRLSFWGRAAQARRSVEIMLGWEPERVILAHGRWYDRDGTAELRRAFRWLQPRG